MKKTIFLVCGRTATGKSSIVHKVCDETDLSYVKSYTTRPMRDSEKEESDHSGQRRERLPRGAGKSVKPERPGKRNPGS